MTNPNSNSGTDSKLQRTIRAATAERVYKKSSKRIAISQQVHTVCLRDRRNQYIEGKGLQHLDKLSEVEALGLKLTQIAYNSPSVVGASLAEGPVGKYSLFPHAHGFVWLSHYEDRHKYVSLARLNRLLPKVLSTVYGEDVGFYIQKKTDTMGWCYYSTKGYTHESHLQFLPKIKGVLGGAAVQPIKHRMAESCIDEGEAVVRMAEAVTKEDWLLFKRLLVSHCQDIGAVTREKWNKRKQERVERKLREEQLKIQEQRTAENKERRKIAKLKKKRGYGKTLDEVPIILHPIVEQRVIADCKRCGDNPVVVLRQRKKALARKERRLERERFLELNPHLVKTRNTGSDEVVDYMKRAYSRRQSDIANRNKSLEVLRRTGVYVSMYSIDSIEDKVDTIMNNLHTVQLNE
jgi:hypothetical protein